VQLFPCCLGQRHGTTLQLSSVHGELKKIIGQQFKIEELREIRQMIVPTPHVVALRYPSWRADRILL
jgi:hypothetical protein